MQYLVKNKIAPNPFIQMLFDTDAEFGMVDVRDVAIGTFKAATVTGLHGKNYLLTSQTYPVSDISLMLNDKKPENNAKTIYQNQLAMHDLGMKFRPVTETFQSIYS